MQPGTVIVLNGTSSSGKTTLLKALQQALEEPFLDAGIDKFIFMLPGCYLEKPLWDDVLGQADRAGAHGHKLFSGMHRSIAALAQAGNCVIADHVLVEPAWVSECARLLADLPAYLVAVRCPLEVIEQRERDRADRTLGQARKQYERAHAHNVYDLEVDTHAQSLADCVARIKAHIATRPPLAFRRLRDGG